MPDCDYLRSELLTRAGFVHGFFTRHGGVSEGPFASLNASPDVGDRPEHVAENLRRICDVLAVAPGRLYVPRQVHGHEVLVLGADHAPSAVASTQADAVVTSEPALACAVRTADCVPLLFADLESRRVAAVHAGWRGVVQNIAGATLEIMRGLGSRPSAIVAAIGPHISVLAFEVGDDVAQKLAQVGGADAVVRPAHTHKARADLGKALVAQLRAAGLPRENLELLPGCTYGDPARFFSYRRDGQQSGRMLSAILSEARGDTIDSGAPLRDEAR